MELRSLQKGGYPFESPVLDLEIFRLVTAIAASETLTEKMQDELDSPKWEHLKQLAFPEICRTMVSIAAIARSNIDSSPASQHADTHLIQRPVGILVSDLEKPDECKSLEFRQACNKILHANYINFGVKDASQGIDSALEPQIYLYGEYYQKEWRVVVDVYAFAMAALHFC
jgi:hypothetical protein